MKRTLGSLNARRRTGRLTYRVLTADTESGMALLTTMLLLILMSILALAMVLTVNADMVINGYYGNTRSSFYAADSGINIARAELTNQLVLAVNMTPCTGWGTTAGTGCTSPPLATASPTNALSYVTTTYGSFTSLNSGEAANSWPASFAIANVTGCANSFALAAGYPTTTQNAQGQNNSYTYRYNYTLCSSGRAQALQQVYTKETGSIVLTIQAQTTTTQQVTVSFAAFGAFINNYPPCLGALVPGTMTGPMFTNGAWQFATGGSYIFTDPVGQANTKADYFINGHCYQSPTSSYTANGQTIKPTFQGGLNLNQPSVALPPNDFSQKWAVLDGKGCGEGGTTCGSGPPPAPTNANLNANLKDRWGNSYPIGGASSGVYLPYCTGGPGCTNPYTINGGGIYVAGNASVQMNVGTDGSSHPTQIYTITQGSTTTTVTTNIQANTTTVTSGSGTTTLTGVPQNLTGVSPSPATVLYVDGDITGLKGPGQGQPAIQDYSQITIAADGNISITGDLVYAHEPVTMNTSDTLISGNDYNQVLGIFTSTGNINLSSPYSNHNLQVDGSLAAIGQSCSSSSCGFTVSGSINTFNNVGGQIQSNIFSASMATQNTYFDRRFTSRAGFAPPWFPSTTLPQMDIINAAAPLVSPAQPQRLSWVTWPQ
ncbi:MAG: hypothetical protein LAN70_16170 [Acidobacteriia bacterium]|nr:hypothetical protein [Terriglobia bacterium]